MMNARRKETRSAPSNRALHTAKPMARDQKLVRFPAMLCPWQPLPFTDSPRSRQLSMRREPDRKRKESASSCSTQLLFSLFSLYLASCRRASASLPLAAAFATVPSSADGAAATSKSSQSTDAPRSPPLAAGAVSMEPVRRTQASRTWHHRHYLPPSSHQLQWLPQRRPLPPLQ